MAKINLTLLSSEAIQDLGFTKGEVIGMVAGPAVGSLLIGIGTLAYNVYNSKKTRDQQAEALEWQKQQAILTHDNIANYAQISTNQAIESMYAMLQEMRSEDDDPVMEVLDEGENT
jgi:hypothetical protein